MSARRIAPLGLLAAAALVAAGCGSSGDSSSSMNTHSGATQATESAATETQSAATPSTTATPGVPTTLKLRADGNGQLKFDKSSLETSAGKVTIKLENPAPLSHNIAIDGVAQQGEVVGHGGISKLTADLKPGKYTYYCAVPGHRQAGMQGTLTVK